MVRKSPTMLHLINVIGWKIIRWHGSILRSCLRKNKQHPLKRNNFTALVSYAQLLATIIYLCAYI